jgi:transcriptional regulator with XRE-family HTH domain
MGGREILAWNVRLLRVSRGLSGDQLALDADIGRNWISKIENEKAGVTIDAVDRIAAALGIPISALFIEPKPGDPRPQPLKGGRKKGR